MNTDPSLNLILLNPLLVPDIELNKGGSNIAYK